eukprot:645975-Amorphochlora_amoeboformis.AAC.2
MSASTSMDLSNPQSDSISSPPENTAPKSSSSAPISGYTPKPPPPGKKIEKISEETTLQGRERSSSVANDGGDMSNWVPDADADKCMVGSAHPYS